MFGRKEREEDPVSTLARCLVLLDDLRAYRRKDVEQVDQMFSKLKKTRFKEHYDSWVKIRPAAEKIVDMPTKVDGVPGMIRMLAWVKVANRVALIVLILFLALQIVPAWKRALGPHPFGGNGLLYSAIAVAVVVVAMNAASLMDFRIRKRIIAYENSTLDEYAPARDKMKEGVSKMMKSLAKEASRSGQNPENYSIILYFNDYDHMKVINQWRPKSMGIFKKSYNHYQVVPQINQ
jgi:hypothetical protein